MQGMNYIGKFFSNFKDFYNDINGATLTGAIDVIVVEQEDGTCNSSPFHVRFGKIGVLRSREKVVDIEVNGDPLDIHMKLGESGEAFFVEELQDSDNEDIPEHLATSPIPVEFEELYNSQGRRRNSLDLGTKLKTPVFENEVNDYTKRRHTASNDDGLIAKDFIKRQIGLGNIEIGENSAEDISLSLASGNMTYHSNDDVSKDTSISEHIAKDFIKRPIGLGNFEIGENSADNVSLSVVSANISHRSSDDVSKDNSISEQIFQMDSLELEPEIQAIIENKPELSLNVKSEEISVDNKNGKKRRRKKSTMKKKNAQRKASLAEPLSAEVTEPLTDSNKPNDSGTDRSSLASNVSENELKDIQKSETDLSASNNRKGLDPDFHFFSDTELTSGPGDSRPISPTTVEGVLSDTEFEVKSRKDGDKGTDGQSWAWGEFPSSTQQLVSPSFNSNIGTSASQAEHNSMLTTVFSFMKHRRQNSSNDGIYLADLSSGTLDPKVAALYFTNSDEKKKELDADMDCESGNGPSLAQSPNSAVGCKSIDSDFEEHHKATQSYLYDITLSMCGWDPEPTEDRFLKHAVDFADLCNNPSVLDSSKLVVRILDKYYNFKVAMPIIASLTIYQRPLPQSTIDQLCNMHMLSQGSQDKRQKSEPRGYSWFGWRRSRNSREATPVPETGANLESIKIEETENKESQIGTVPEEIPSRKVDILATEDGYFGSQSSGSDHGKDVAMVEEKPIKPISTTPKSDKSDKCRKTLRLSSDQIRRLNLRDGLNEVEFSVTTAYQGTTRCKCHIYKWKWDDKIVISDIDGTITKSDVLGHILPIVGKDWAQSGVAQLFNKIEDNGYKLLYLSARAIGQAHITREYLKSIKQGDLYMPDGPILLNPTSLITAFHREVIEKKPEQFKISCMSDIRALFPGDSNPFYAGYGNRINDVWAYRAVGIPIVRIFTINPKGELKHELTQTFQSSYSNMSNFVDQLFPPLIEAANDYSQFSYWRDPIPVFQELDVEIAK